MAVVCAINLRMYFVLRTAFIVFYIMAAAKSVRNVYFYQNRELDFNILDEMKICERHKIQSLQFSLEIQPWNHHIVTIVRNKRYMNEIIRKSLFLSLNGGFHIMTIMAGANSVITMSFISINAIHKANNMET